MAKEARELEAFLTLQGREAILQEKRENLQEIYKRQDPTKYQVTDLGHRNEIDYLFV